MGLGAGTAAALCLVLLFGEALPGADCGLDMGTWLRRARIDVTAFRCSVNAAMMEGLICP